MPANHALSYILVAIQFVCLGAIAVTGPLIAQNLVWLVVEVAAVGLGVWAIFSVRIGNFNITPTVRATGELITHGPYRVIRHPMYTALLLGSLALVANAPSWWRWVLWIVLAADLVVKLRYEERLLAAHFLGYAEYRQRTRRLIPFVF
jgi:protein-S-isoprenylcysteine O-methyltransferase Ste14